MIRLKSLLKEQGIGDYIQGLTKSPNQGDTVYGQTTNVRDAEKQQAARIAKQLETDPNKRLINFAEDIASNIYSIVNKYSKIGSTILPGTSHEGYCNQVLTQLERIENPPARDAQFYNNKKLLSASLWQIVLEWISKQSEVETKTQTGASSWIHETLKIIKHDSSTAATGTEVLCRDLDMYWSKTVNGKWKSQFGNLNWSNIIKPDLEKS